MAGGGESSPIINGIVKNDKVPWYRKKNLRRLYICLVPFAMFIESTSGFDSSMMNVSLPSPEGCTVESYPEKKILTRGNRVYKRSITGKITSTIPTVRFSVFSSPATVSAPSRLSPSSHSSPTGSAVAFRSSLGQLS
jgi:hypothetical protein